MFDGGVKETLCTRCAHRDVCAHKQDYFDILKAVENATVTRDTGDGKIISFRRSNPLKLHEKYTPYYERR